MTCHTERNFTLMERASYRSIPGHPRWMVAPIEMAWEGKSVGEIAARSRIPPATEAATSHCCMSIWLMTIWWRGAGSRALGATRRPVHKQCLAN